MFDLSDPATAERYQQLFAAWKAEAWDRYSAQHPDQPAILSVSEWAVDRFGDDAENAEKTIRLLLSSRHQLRAWLDDPSTR